MIKKHVEHNSGIAPPYGGKARQSDIHHGVAIGVHVDASMQGNRRFDLRIVQALQRPFDEVAVEAAEQSFPAGAAEVQVCEIVHGAKLSTAAPISL